MANAKCVYDGFQFDFGEWPPGDIPRPRPFKEFKPVGPDDHVPVEPGNSFTVGFTVDVPFEMAVTGRPTRRV